MQIHQKRKKMFQNSYRRDFRGCVNARQLITYKKVMESLPDHEYAFIVLKTLFLRCMGILFYPVCFRIASEKYELLD